MLSPVLVLGIVVAGPGSQPPAEEIPTGLVIRSIGYTGQPLDGLPFDSAHGTVPHREGRIIDPATGDPVTGRYVAGWIKRGSRGGIGANSRCGEETARSVLADAAAGILHRPVGDIDVATLAEQRGATIVDGAGWRRIDSAERAAGINTGRTRIKLTDYETLLAAAGYLDTEQTHVKKSIRRTS